MVSQLKSGVYCTARKRHIQDKLRKTNGLKYISFSSHSQNLPRALVSPIHREERYPRINLQAVCESGNLDETASSRKNPAPSDRTGYMALPEELRRRISTQVASTVQAFETQLFEQVSSIACESEEYMASNHPQFQNSNFDDFFTMTDLQTISPNPAYGMQDMRSPSADPASAMRDLFSSVPLDQSEFGFLPSIWDSLNEEHPPTANPPITPSPSHSGGLRTENMLSSTPSKDTDVMSLFESLKKNFQELEKRIQGS
jgi:hypothetical protein